MKLKLIVIMAVLALAIPSVTAQNYRLDTLLGGTANVAATVTNTTFATTNSTVMFTRASDIGVQVQFKLTGAGTSAVVLKFDESVDSSVWSTATRTLSITASTTNVVSGRTNLTLGSIGYLRLSQIENPNATAITNLTIKYSQKLN